MKLLLAIPLALAPALAAQPIVVPAAGANGPGNAQILWNGQERRQQVHTEFRGLTANLQAIAFRRATPQTRPTAALGIEVLMTMAPANANGFGPEFDRNLLGPPTVTIDRRPLQMPAWSVGVSQPFDVRIPFDRPYAHGAGNDLLFDLRIISAAAPQHIFDGFGESIANNFGSAKGSSCGTLAGVGFATEYFTSSGGSCRLVSGMDPTPPSVQQVFSAVGHTDPVANLPGLCGTIHCSLDVVFPLRRLPLGAWHYDSGFTLRLPPNFQSLLLEHQGFTIETGGGTSISNGYQSVVLPAPAGLTLPGRCLVGERGQATGRVLPHVITTRFER